ncbi:hypothetical protein B5P43_30595 [Bacillus sp. SRB_336]|nr:hypothetical protein B5P43_30595 [Bacillus sp. SRB_336]
MAAPDADITPHAVGTSLQFECQDPIGTGATSGALAGPHAIGVPDVMAISAPAIGAGSIQWGAGATYQGFRFAKVGLVLKSGVPFTLSVPATMRGSMKIGWSNSGYTLADTLTGAGCTSNQPDAGWLVYPGGFWLKAPVCVPLTVTSGQSSETINIPVGKPCP